MEFTAVTRPIWEVWDKIKMKSLNDPEITKIRQEIDQQEGMDEDFEWRDGMLFFKGKVWASIIRSLRT